MAPVAGFFHFSVSATSSSHSFVVWNRYQARSQAFVLGGAIQGGGRPNEARRASLQGGTRLSRTFWKTWVFLKNWNFKTDFFGKEITLLLTVRWWVCTIASEESLFSAASITFLPQKTADILHYAQRQRATKKTNNVYLHLLQAKKLGPACQNYSRETHTLSYILLK